MYWDANGMERLPVTEDYINLQDAEAAAEQVRDEAREAAVASELAALKKGGRKGPRRLKR
jgi:hypothetical protein